MSTSPLPIVAATPRLPNTNAATKLKNAAQMTACVGVRTRVENHGGDGVGGIVKAVAENQRTRAAAMITKIIVNSAVEGRGGGGLDYNGRRRT